MAARIHADRAHVLKRLRELSGWAEYIRDSVTRDQPYEEGKTDLLETSLGEGPTLALRSETALLVGLLESAIDRLDDARMPLTTLPHRSVSR